LKGRIQFKPCTNDYLCGKCEFDQYFYDEYTVHAVVRPVDVLEVEGFKVPQGYYLHNGHTWVKIEEGSSVRIGVDDFALSLLGPLDRVEAPLMGKVMKQGKPQVLLSRGEHKAKLLSPLSGVITAVNPKLREQGSLANQDPYTEGWVMTLHPQNLRKEIKDLMIAQQTAEFLEQEVERLHHLIEEVSAPLATDGGYLGKDVFGAMPQLGWERLTRSFLRN
jgi:glycine cleavage system H lipoate-binding protein